jgi:hypothetical protein
LLLEAKDCQLVSASMVTRDSTMWRIDQWVAVVSQHREGRRERLGSGDVTYRDVDLVVAPIAPRELWRNS